MTLYLARRLALGESARNRTGPTRPAAVTLDAEGARKSLSMSQLRQIGTAGFSRGCRRWAIPKLDPGRRR
jgi:hypothetical protein